ncbi:MAG: PKD domain-containing protein [Bacteroidota bacterium]
MISKSTIACRSVVLICLLTFSWSLQAFHIIGGDIFYVCLGPDPANPMNMRYRFTIKMYRDCQGGGQDFDSLPGTEPGTVSVFLGDDPMPYINTIVLPEPTVTAIPPDAANPCVIIPPNVCVQEGIYVFEQSLPISTESYHMTYQRCCRNSTINNIMIPDEIGTTYTIELTPIAQQECNSSPAFNEFPPIVICANQLLSFDHSATDPDGDQLVYEFCSPLLGGGLFGNPYEFDGIFPNPDAPPPYNTVNFVLPTYSPLSPLGANPPMNLDPVTGLLTGTPPLQGQFVVGICVKEFRNGVLLSEVRRDFQFNVANCEPTVVANIEAPEIIDDVYTFYSCEDSTIVMNNLSNSIQFIDDYLWEFTGGALSSNPLTFTEWNIAPTFPGPGEYDGMLWLNKGTPCSDSARIKVIITPPLGPSITFDYDTCVAGPVSFFGSTAAASSLIDGWRWTFGDGNVAEEINPIHEYEDPGLFPVELTVTDLIGCSASIAQEVNWFPAPPIVIIEPSAEEGCPPMEVTFTNLSSPIDETYDIQWAFGDGDLVQALSPSHTYQLPGTYTVAVGITSPIGCYTSDTFTNLIFVDSFPEAAFTYSPQTNISNFNPTVQFTDQSNPYVLEWFWDFGDGQTTIIQNPSHTFQDTGLIQVQLIGTHFYVCQDTFFQWIDVEPQVTFFMPNAFTPNSDNLNEEFKPGGFFRGITDYRLSIYDRWGSRLFESRDINIGWNGQRNNTGRAASNGSYVYMVSYRGPRGQIHQSKGTLVLIR